MAGSVQKAKIPGRLLLAFLKQRFKNFIGDEIADEVGDIGEDLLGESLDQWLNGKQGQIERAEGKARACFEDACRQQGLDGRFLQWIESLPLDDLPALQRAIARLPQQTDDSHLRQALQSEIAAAWKELHPDQVQLAVELYLDCLKRGLATQRDFRQDILVKEVLAIASQVARIRQETALIPKILTILEWLEARLDGGQPQPARYQPPPLPPIEELQDLNRLPPGSWVAHLRNPFFTGREEDLKALAQALLYRPGEGQAVGITGTPHAAAATGLGGIGKSQLAVEFCWRYGGYFQGVHWVPAGGSIPAGIAYCGEQMGLQPWPDEQAEQVQVTLKAWRESGRRLVVLDDVPDSRAVAEWLPRLGNARLLVTSRWMDWPADLALEPIPLDMLSLQESLSLLRKLAPRLGAVEDSALAGLAECLYRLPLALDLAGRYLKDRPGLTVGYYLGELERQQGLLGHRSLADWARHNPTDHKTSLAASFLLSWRWLDGRKKVERLAQMMFRAAGYCATNTPIPEEVLLRAAGAEDENILKQAERGLQRLFGLGLLERAGKGASIHPLLAELARALDGEREQAGLAALAGALGRLSEIALDTGEPAPFKPLRPHVQIAAGQAEANIPEKAATLWSDLGYHLHMVAEYAAARAAYERAVGIWEQALGPEHPNVATDVNNLGLELKEQGDLAGARAAFERALGIWEQALGPEHPEVAAGVNNLGSVLKEQGDLAGARAAFERALGIDERAYGPEHPNVATDVNNLGMVLKEQGDLAGARAAFERALAILEQALGPQHPQVALGVNNLGSVLKEQGDLAGARAAFERALAIFEKYLGADHPNVATLVNNLGLVLQDLGDLAGARAALERALEIDERVYGPQHPEVARYINNLGGVLQDLGDLAGARAAYQRALGILEKSLPEGHPNIRIVRGNLQSLDDAMTGSP